MQKALIFVGGALLGAGLLFFLGWLYFAWTWMRDH